MLDMINLVAAFCAIANIDQFEVEFPPYIGMGYVRLGDRYCPQIILEFDADGKLVITKILV